MKSKVIRMNDKEMINAFINALVHVIYKTLVLKKEGLQDGKT